MRPYRLEVKFPSYDELDYRPLPSGPDVNAKLDTVPGSIECPRCHVSIPVGKLAEIPRRCPECGHG